MAIQAKFSGKCPDCGGRYAVGTLIERRGPWDHWYPVECSGCKRRAEELKAIHDLKDRMLQKHNVWLGVMDNPPGSRGLFTPAEFFREMEARGEGTPEERELFKSFYWRTWNNDGLG